MPDFGELAGPLFDPVVKAVSKTFMPEGLTEEAGRAGEAAVESAPKLSDYATGAAPAPAPAPRIRVPVPPKQPLQPTTRVQQMAPEHAELGAKMEVSPGYLDHIDKLGGGRVVTNDETVAKALNSTPMTEDELSGWKAETPTNTVHVTRGHLLWSDMWSKYFEAIRNNDDETASDMENRINKVSAGYNNITATPGRALQIQSIFQEQDAIQNKVRQLRAAGVPFNVVKQEIDGDLADMHERTKDAKPQEQTLLQKIEDYATAAKLSSPVTWENKSVTDGLTYLYRGVEQHIRAATMELGGRPEEADALRSYAFGTTQGFKDGWRKFLDDFNPSRSPQGDILEKPVGKMRYAISFPFRVLSAQTDLWHSVIYDSEINTRLHMAASKMVDSNDPVQMTYAMQALRENLPEDWHNDAVRVANEYTFQENPDRLLQALQKMQRVPGMRFVLPVVKLPYNLTRFAIRRSPVGLMSGENIGLMRGNALEKSQAVARLGLGLSLYGVAGALVAHGNVNGALPNDPRERAMWEAEGRVPFSIRVGSDQTGKAKWFKYSKLGPLGLMLTSVAGVHEALRNNDFDAAQQRETTAMEHIDGVAKRLVYQMAHGALDIPFLEDLQSLIDGTMDSERKFDGLTRSVATGFLPNFLRDFRNQLDPEERKPTSVVEALENMIPGFSGQVMPKRTVLNTPIESEQNHLLRAFKNTAPSLEDENTKFLRSISWAPIQPPTTLRSQGRSAKLTGENLRNYQKEMGEVTLAAVQSVMNDPNLPTNPADARKMTARIVEAARKPIAKKYMAVLGLHGPEAQAEAEGIGQ